MKKALVFAGAVALGLFAGCKSIPSTDTMYTTSKAIGISAGMIANQTKIDGKTRNAIVDVMNEVAMCVPETNQTFEAAWTPIAKRHVGKLIEEGKLDVAQGELVMSAFNLAVKGIDYLFEYRYPKAKQYKDLTAAGMDGFISGFLMVFKPANGLAAYVLEYDKEAYRVLNAK